MTVVKWDIENMLEVSLEEPDNFLKVRETLSRIGVASRKEVAKSKANELSDPTNLEKAGILYMPL